MKTKPVATLKTSMISRKEFNKMIKEIDPEGELKKLGLRIAYKNTKKK